MAINKPVWFGVGGAMLVMAGLMTYMVATKDDDDSTNERTGATALQPVININTQTPDSLVLQMSVATVDICYKREPAVGLERDLLDPVFISDTKKSGFHRMFTFADGAIMNVSHILTPPPGGNGYNGLRSDFPSDQAYKEAMSGALSQTWQSDFFLKTNEYLRVMALPGDIGLNPHDTWAQNKYRIENSTGEYVLLGSELVTTDVPRKWTPAQYLAWAKPTIDSIKKYFPGKKLIADQGQLYVANRNNLLWRKDINPTTLPGIYAADCYFQGNDQMGLTLNMDSNIMKIDRLWDVTFPFLADSFRRSFPGWKWIPGEVHNIDARKGWEHLFFINKNMVGCYFWGCAYIAMIKQQDLIPMAIHMELKKYIDPSENNSKMIALLNSFLKPGYNVTDVTLENMEGCKASSIRNIAQPKSHAILITNNSTFTYTLPKVVIDGKNKSPEFTCERMYSTTWDGVVSKDTVTSSTITILPRSVSITTFTTGTTAQVPTVESKIK